MVGGGWVGGKDLANAKTVLDKQDTFYTAILDQEFLMLGACK